MERVVNECASHLINDLTKDTCLDTRSLPGINRNKSFVDKVDQFIAENVSGDYFCNIFYEVN
jgi:influenza virus NS1A-binding protein